VPQAFFIPITVTAANFALATALAVVWNTIVSNVVLGLVSKALFKKPRGMAPPINVTVRNAVESRRLLFGTMRAGGTFVYFNVSGVDDRYLWYVIVYAGHQVAAIKDVWFDTVRVANADINGGAAGGGAVTAGKYANRLVIYKHLGTSAQTVNSTLDAEFSEWTSDHRLRGCGYIVARLQKDQKVWDTGAPQSVTALLDGALLYDPRKDGTVPGGSGAHRKTDPSTWEFGTIGRIPALQWRWFVSGGSVHNDLTSRLIRYGLRAADARIPDSYVIAAANKCDEVLTGSAQPPGGDEPRYRCDLEVSCGQTRREIIEDILATMAGAHVPIHGEHRVYAGGYDAPVHAFTEADLYGDIEIEDTVDHDRRYNKVAAVFRSSAHQFIEQTTLFRTDSAYVTQDNGEEIPVEIDAIGTTSGTQAQRLAEIKLRKSRMMRTIKIRGGLDLWKVALYETLTLSHARFGWSGRVFRCLERQLIFGEEIGKVELTCQREDAGVWTDLLTGNYETGTSATDVFTNDVASAPTSLTTTAFPGFVRLTIGLPSIRSVGDVVEIWEYTANTPFSSATKIAEAHAIYFMLPKEDTTTRYYWVRMRNLNGIVSAEYPSGNGVAGAAELVDSVDMDPGAAAETHQTSGTGLSQVCPGGSSSSSQELYVTFTPTVDCDIVITLAYKAYMSGGAGGFTIRVYPFRSLGDGSSQATDTGHRKTITNTVTEGYADQWITSVVGGTQYRAGIFVDMVTTSNSATLFLDEVDVVVEEIRR
jgi:hypothetical protein